MGGRRIDSVHTSEGGCPQSRLERSPNCCARGPTAKMTRSSSSRRCCSRSFGAWFASHLHAFPDQVRRAGPGPEKIALVVATSRYLFQTTRCTGIEVPDARGAPAASTVQRTLAPVKWNSMRSRDLSQVISLPADGNAPDGHAGVESTEKPTRLSASLVNTCRELIQGGVRRLSVPTHPHKTKRASAIITRAIAAPVEKVRGHYTTRGQDECFTGYGGHDVCSVSAYWHRLQCAHQCAQTGSNDHQSAANANQVCNRKRA